MCTGVSKFVKVGRIWMTSNRVGSIEINGQITDSHERVHIWISLCQPDFNIKFCFGWGQNEV